VSEQIFNEPRVALNRIYTRMGDGGQTRLVGGKLLGKMTTGSNATAR
jgi:cob(I)alamin adenosyltransferase